MVIDDKPPCRRLGCVRPRHGRFHCTPLVHRSRQQLLRTAGRHRAVFGRSVRNGLRVASGSWVGHNWRVVVPCARRFGRAAQGTAPPRSNGQSVDRPGQNYPARFGLPGEPRSITRLCSRIDGRAQGGCKIQPEQHDPGLVRHFYVSAFPSPIACSVIPKQGTGHFDRFDVSGLQTPPGHPGLRD